MRFFASGFFHESVSPKPLTIPLGPFNIFSKIRGDILSTRFATGFVHTNGNLPPASLTPVANLVPTAPSNVPTRWETFPGDCNHGVHKMTHSAESERFGLYGCSILPPCCTQKHFLTEKLRKAWKSWKVLKQFYNNSLFLKFNAQF
jgi:hypothetical protein